MTGSTAEAGFSDSYCRSVEITLSYCSKVQSIGSASDVSRFAS